MTFDVTSLLGVLPVTAREITRDETSISWRKVKLRLSVSRSNAPSPESVNEDLPDYEDAPEASSHTNDRGGAEEDEESEEEDELEEDNEVASDNEYSNHLPDLPPQRPPSALGLDFTSPIDLTHDDREAHVLSQLAGIDLRGDSTHEASSSETRLREAEAFIASAVLQSHSFTPSPSPLSPPEPLHEHETQSTSVSMIARRVGRYETVYTLSDPDTDDDEEPYFEISRPGIARWSSSPTATSTKHTRAPTHRELSLHPRIPSFLSVIPRYHRAYSTTWFTKNDRVKRVLDTRKRRYASNPDVGRGEGFVKKAIERFGPTWRPRLPSVFDRVLKKKAGDSAVTVDVVFSDSRSLVGEGIDRPANVPRMDDPHSDAYTRLTVPPTTDTQSAGDVSISIQSDATMVVPDEEVPACIVVPSTPPPPLPSLVAPQPQPSTVPLPYLVSQANSNRAGGGDYPYVATPPLELTQAVDFPVVSSSSHSHSLPLPYLVPQADSGGGGQVEYAYIPTPPLDPIALPTPLLTREASFGSENSSFVPTPESGRLTLPTLPVDAFGVPCVAEIYGGKSVKYGSPVGDDGARYEYVVTPPLPTTGLPPTPSSIVPPSRATASFTPLSSTSTLNPPLQPPAPIMPPTLTLPTLPPPPLTTMLPSFPVGQPPPPLPPLQPIIPPTLPLTLPNPPMPAQPPPPPLITVLPSFPVGQPPPPLPPLPPLIPPLVPSLSVGVPLAGAGYMRSPPLPASASSGFFHPPEAQMIMQPSPLQSSSFGSGSSLVPQQLSSPAAPTPSATATAPALQLQIPPLDRIAESTLPSESMDCEEDAYAPLIKMTSPTEVQPSRPDFVMGEEGGLYAVAGRDIGHINREPLRTNSSEVANHVADVHTEGPSYQGASGSGCTAGKDDKGKGKAKDDSEGGLDGDTPPFDESDPLWEELLAYKENPDDGDVLGSGSSSCADAAGQGKVVASTSQHVEVTEDFTSNVAFDLGSSNTSWDSDELSWDFSDVLNPGANNPPHPSESQGDVWKELCAWADEQPPELLESVFGMLDTSVAEAPVESVGLGDFPLLEESSCSESPIPIIAVEPPTPPQPSPPKYYPQPQFAQNITDFDEKRRIYPSGLEVPTSFTLDELDWAVMEEYAQLEDLECPDNSVDAARVMVVAIRAVADKAKMGFAGMSEDRVFLPPVVDFPSVCPGRGVQNVSPAYEYVSLLDEDVQVPLTNSQYYQPFLPPTSFAHVLAAS